MTVKRAHIIVEGRVQGVFYRASMKEMADIYGVKGWVRNLPSGEVEAVAEGDSNAIDDLVKWCRQGPPNAAVDQVCVDWETPKNEFKSFEIRR